MLLLVFGIIMVFMLIVKEDQGLALLWVKDVNVTLLSNAYNHIDVMVTKRNWIYKENSAETKCEGGLRLIRDLEYVNAALLAKQVWRLKTQGRSLAFNVLSSKFFSNANIMETRIGTRLSPHRWHSIWGAQWVAKKGALWLVGDGESIRTWVDKWLPRPKLEGCTLEWVNDLIDRETATQDAGMRSYSEVSRWHMTLILFYDFLFVMLGQGQGTNKCGTAPFLRNLQ